jgi:hypothetical protein
VEQKTDSEVHHQDRRAKMQEEAAENQHLAIDVMEKREAAAAERQRAAREAEGQELTRQAELIKPGETRDMLVERIRKLREQDEPKAVEAPPLPRPPELQRQFELEQKAGREAVARAKEDQERTRELRRKYEEEERAKLGETVIHANPGQNEVFPTSKPK